MQDTQHLPHVDHFETNSDTLSPDALQRLRANRALHLDHYGGKRLPFACLASQGLNQRMVQLEGAHGGAVHEVLDASGGYASACLGAGHPVVKRALLEAIEHSGYVTDEIDSCERSLILEYLFGPDGLWQEQFAHAEYHVSGRNSGSEGIELALRLVLESGFDQRTLAPRPGRKDRRTILAFEGAWHGWTSGALALLNRRHFRVGLPEFVAEGPFSLKIAYLPFGESAVLESFFAQNGDTLAAVFVEPIQGDAGILVPPPGYLRQLADLCRRYEVLLVADEVLTFAKSGHFFAMRDDHGPIPTDITVVGKSLGMGALSTSMVIARRALTIRPSGAVATSDLRPLTCALMHAGLKYIVEEDLLGRSRVLGEALRAMLQRELVDRFPSLYREVRGLGFLNGIEVTERAAAGIPKLRARLIEHGVYVEFMAGAGRRSKGLRYLFPAMRIAPPLIASHEQLATIVERLRAGTEAFLEEGG